MTQVPSRHLRRSHGALVAELYGDARADFARPGRPSWDPARRTGDGEIDLGRGLLDSFAVALHVLWTYQQAWAEETFLATARLDSSVDKLLGHIGYRPRPGVAAVGVQHFRCRASAPGLIATGLGIVSPPKGGEAEASYETLAPVRVDPLLNELRGFLPPLVRAPAPAPITGTPSDDGSEPKTPSGGLFGTGSALASLQDRLDAARFGPLAERRAARAKAKARNLAKLVSELGLDQASADCKDKLDGMCAELCAAQHAVEDAQAALLAGATPDLPPGSLSESQEIIARQLRILAKRNKDAVAALEAVLARYPGESLEAYARRLDQMAAFLDAFIGSVIQESRDQLVLLRGPAVFSRLDAAFSGGGTPARGYAPVGTDALYLPPLVQADGRSIDPPVQLGDYLVIGLDTPRVGPDGKPYSERRFHEAFRVVRLTREVPRGETRPMVRIQFQPPLARAYDLDRAVLLGNIGLVSHGKTVVEKLTLAADGRTARLTQGPLTWLRDPGARNGRAPQVSVTVAGRAWRRVDDLLAAGPDDPVFAVEPAPGGGIRLRFGDATSGARVVPGTAIVATYRIGVGVTGNRAAARVDGLASTHPSVESTTNPLAIGGGADAETRTGARALGPTAVGAIDRAISLADVVALARGYDGVDRARATRDPRAPHRIAVVVCGPERAALSGPELDALQRHLRVRVPPGLEVKVDNRVLVPVYLALIVRYQRGADPIAVVRAVRDRLGVDPGAAAGLLAAPAIDLGDDLPVSAIYEATDGIAGLHSIVVRQLYRADEAPGLHARIVTQPREVLAWAAPADGKDGVAIAYEEGQEL